jgi:hypothetical protein
MDSRSQPGFGSIVLSSREDVQYHYEADVAKNENPAQRTVTANHPCCAGRITRFRLDAWPYYGSREITCQNCKRFFEVWIRTLFEEDPELVQVDWYDVGSAPRNRQNR